MNKTKDDVDSGESIVLTNGDEDIEKSTNGPYDSFHSHAELQDDPAAMVEQDNDENYASTIEPDTVTTIPSDPY